MNYHLNTLIIGAGAAGFFAGFAAKEANPHLHVAILEKGISLLSKVKISGGGRCNVTHACFDPKVLVQNYPRGHKELIGAFYRFQPEDTIDWFHKRGVKLKTETDGRMFPITNSSQTIIDCFLEEAKQKNIDILTKQNTLNIKKTNEGFQLKTKQGLEITFQNLILATGSSSQGHLWAQQLGHTIQKTVPSLFTFNCPSSHLKNLSGLSIPSARVLIKDSSFHQKGPILLTHFGFSGPCILKLSAWAARYLAMQKYKFTISINWLGDQSEESVKRSIHECKMKNCSKSLLSQNLFHFPKRFWMSLIERLGLTGKELLNNLSSKQISELSHLICHDNYSIEGKTTNKEEFVTCGGITLNEVNFKSMESKICKGLFFAGEILDIDGVTGGFNFQNAWTTGYLAGYSSSTY